MGELKQLLGRADALYRDTEFAAVHRWKEEKPGRKAVGILPVYAPRELIHAAGMLPVGVVGHGDLEIIRGDAYFQSYICHLPRSVIELAVSGKLDCLDGMLFPSTCDVIRNLSGMWKMELPDVYVKYFDVPQNFAGEVGGEFYRHELQSMRHDFEELSGAAITDEALRKSIAIYNENRGLISELYRVRAQAPWNYPAGEVYLMVRAGYMLPVEEHNTWLRSYLDLASQRELQPLDNIRVVVSGAFCEQPPVDLIRTLERAGCYIVGDDFFQGLRWFKKPVSTEGDPIANLVHSFLHESNAAASLYQADGKNGEELVQTIGQAKADGVICAAPSFCDPALLDQPMNVAALDAAKIPYTAFKYAENAGQFQVIREQAGTFADSIRLWGDA